MEEIRNDQSYRVAYFPNNVCMKECNTHTHTHKVQLTVRLSGSQAFVYLVLMSLIRLVEASHSALWPWSYDSKTTAKDNTKGSFALFSLRLFVISSSKKKKQQPEKQTKYYRLKFL